MQFILNQQTVTVDIPSGITLLDYIRYHKHLKGTKIGCREGDCGACTVLVGTLVQDKVQYQSLTSCLTPLANVLGKHVVTIEGINAEALTPVQQAMVDENGTQCGFCTVGFIMSLTGNAFQERKWNQADLIASIDGNICRCTGYKSIERAATKLLPLLNAPKIDFLKAAIQENFVPSYFADIPNRLKEIQIPKFEGNAIFVGGGTDLYVQKHAEMEETQPHPLTQNQDFKFIQVKEDIFHLGAATTVSEIANHPAFQSAFSNFNDFIKLISSTQIRNIATLTGNIVNASPIGDLSAFLLALDAQLILENKSTQIQRIISLKDFYTGYKQLAKLEDEFIQSIQFTKPSRFFNFEKVCKRTHLDIASVNSACQIILQNEQIQTIHLSFGGVFAYPFYAHQTKAFLEGKTLSIPTLQAANEVLQAEIKPISDVRGTEAYKRLLARQLFYAHFVTLFDINPL